MEPKEILVLVAEIEQYLPLVKKITPLVEQFGRDIKPTIEKLSDNFCDLKIRQFNKFIDSGMTREEALLLVLSSKINIDNIKNLTKKEK